MFRHVLCAATFAALSSPVFATVFATGVVDATVWGTTMPDDPTAVLGSPSPIVGADYGYPEILSPFSPAYDGDQIYTISPGNQLTLDMGVQIKTGAGPEIGVFANNGLDGSPNFDGSVSGSASLFSPPGAAIVSVSDDNVTYHVLNSGAPITFDIPYNYFANASGPFDTDPPADPVYADFSKPFLGTLSSFDNQDWAGVLAVLDGSAGGTWVDANGSGLSSFRYVRFDVPADGQRVVLDAVSAVPEPTGIALVALPALVLTRRRSRI